MRDLSPKSVALLDTARDGFAPSTAARMRMRGAFLARVAGASGAPNSADGVGASPGDGRAPESGRRLAVRANAGMLLVGLLVVLAGSTFAVMRSRTPAHASAPSSVVVGGASGPGASTDTIEPAPAVSPHVLPDVLPDVLPEASPIIPPNTPVARDPGVRSRRLQVVAERTPAPAPPPVPTAAGGETDNAGDVDSLEAEMRFVREAQAALRAGDLERARRVVDAHASAYPAGVLREERLVLSVLLLCAEGRIDRARRTAEELVLAHPRSSHLEPLRTSCAGSVVP